MLLPPQPVDDAVVERVLDGLDGLVITGGRDVDPAAYGQITHHTTDEPARDRDAWEFALLRGALAARLPVLGICRGAQVLNVALGGTLHQHLPDVVGPHPPSGRQRRVHHVVGPHRARYPGGGAGRGVDRGAVLSPSGDRRTGARPDRRVPRDSADGVIEAVELPGDAFVVAVQWHPEERLDDLRLFAGVVAAAREYATGVRVGQSAAIGERESVR